MSNTLLYRGLALLFTSSTLLLVSPTSMIGCVQEPSYRCETDPDMLELARERVEQVPTQYTIVDEDGVLDVTLTLDSTEARAHEYASPGLPIATAHARPPCSGHAVLDVRGRIDVDWTATGGEKMRVAEGVEVTGIYTQRDDIRGGLHLTSASYDWFVSPSCYGMNCALDLEGRVTSGEPENWIEVREDVVIQLDLSIR